MDLTQLKDRPVEWLRGGPEGDVVVSSRVRLARNVDGYPFVSRATRRQTARIEEVLRGVIMSLGMDPGLEYVRIDETGPLLRELLLERRLISRELAEAAWVRGIAFDASERLSIMVNEEDHIRLQCMHGGLSLEEVYERADHFDDVLSSRIPFAFSSRYGYLTACPRNVGTGMRASVMLHLPGIVMAQEMDRVLDLVREDRLALRGIYEESDYGAGNFYQVSNVATLGVSEEELWQSVQSAGIRLAEMERAARRALHRKHRVELRERIDRALRMLLSARTISWQEASSLLSQVRMGVEMDLLKDASMDTLNDLLLLTLPAHLQTMEGEEMDSAVRNERRATYVKQRLATG